MRLNPRTPIAVALGPAAGEEVHVRVGQSCGREGGEPGDLTAGDENLNLPSITSSFEG